MIELMPVLNRIFNNEVFTYIGKLHRYSPLTITMKYKIEIMDIIHLSWIGVNRPYFKIRLHVLDFKSDIRDPEFNKPLIRIISENPMRYDIRIILEREITSILLYFSYDGLIKLDSVVFDQMSDPSQITESSSDRNMVVRTITKDIINIIKKNTEGGFSLPEDMNRGDEVLYNFSNIINPFIVELHVGQSDKIDTFDVDGGYYYDDDVLEVIVIYNPNKMPQIMYNMLGELTELIRHEIQHILQSQRGEDLSIENKQSSEEYYSHPQELEAQIKGFKRHAKLSKTSLDKIIRSWFEKYQEKHNLTPQEKENVIQKILNYYSSTL